MKNIQIQIGMVIFTIVFFLLMWGVNEWLFSGLQFANGSNWIYLPAGVRLLCTLLFAEAGALGLLLVSWLICFCYLFPDDWMRSLSWGLVDTLAPYGTFCAARHCMGLGSSLRQLTPQRLLWLSVFYAVANASLHLLLSTVRGDGCSVDTFIVMALGDLSGTLIVLYAFKALLVRLGGLNRYELK